MGTIAINYSSLENASKEAKQVARKLDSYASSLEKNVYNKLNKYSGTWTTNLEIVQSKVNSKINELRNESNLYTNYADD